MGKLAGAAGTARALERKAAAAVALYPLEQAERVHLLIERRAAEIEAMGSAERAVLAARALRLLQRLRGAGKARGAG